MSKNILVSIKVKGTKETEFTDVSFIGEMTLPIDFEPDAIEFTWDDSLINLQGVKENPSETPCSKCGHEDNSICRPDKQEQLSHDNRSKLV